MRGHRQYNSNLGHSAQPTQKHIITLSRQHPQRPLLSLQCLDILKFVFIIFPRIFLFLIFIRQTKAYMATTTTVTRLTLSPTTPVTIPLPLPTTTHSPEATLKSTTHIKQHALLHLPLTKIPLPIPPLTPHHHNSPMHSHASPTPCPTSTSLLHPLCTTSPPLIRSSTMTRTLVSATRATCPYCAHHLHAHKSQCI